jgi:5'-nucleotidase / UDP-sugar diphosphatase
MRVQFTVGALLASFASACASYNDQCVALVDNPNERVAFVAKEMWLDKANARHANNALGQAVTDGFVWVFKDSDRPVDFAVLNGGSLRAEGLCVSRSILPTGPLTNGVLHEIMLFENQVVAVDLAEQEVADLFEHSVDRLIAAPTPILASPAGQFLQVSQEVSMAVDCSKPVGSRVTALSIKGQEVQRPGRPLATVKYRVALSTYLAGGGDGYAMIAGKNTDPARNPGAAPRFGGIDSGITTAFLKQSTANQTLEQGLQAASRVQFTNCSVPTRPTN